jgi:hypothetical protein
MKKTRFLVGIREVHVRTVSVMATDEQDAREQCSGPDEPIEVFTEYSHQLPWDHWTVENTGYPHTTSCCNTVLDNENCPCPCDVAME